MHKNHGFPAIFSWNTKYFSKCQKTRHGYERSKKIQKEIDDLEWKIHNEVVDEDAKNALKEKIADLKKVIITMLESLPGMR